jgi:hypothetical protein
MIAGIAIAIPSMCLHPLLAFTPPFPLDAVLMPGSHDASSLHRRRGSVARANIAPTPKDFSTAANRSFSNSTLSISRLVLVVQGDREPDRDRPDGLVLASREADRLASLWVPIIELARIHHTVRRDLPSASSRRRIRRRPGEGRSRGQDLGVVEEVGELPPRTDARCLLPGVQIHVPPAPVGWLQVRQGRHRGKGDLRRVRPSQKG